MEKNTSGSNVKDQQSKFNFDLANQELLHSILKAAISCRLSNRNDLSFDALCQALIVINPDLSPDERENIYELEDKTEQVFGEINMIMGYEGIYFDDLRQSYALIPNARNVRRVIPQNFWVLQKQVGELVDQLHIALRGAMVRMGLINVKNKTGADAASS